MKMGNSASQAAPELTLGRPQASPSFLVMEGLVRFYSTATSVQRPTRQLYQKRVKHHRFEELPKRPAADDAAAAGLVLAAAAVAAAADAVALAAAIAVAPRKSD